MRIGEITFIDAQNGVSLFKVTKVIRADISLSEFEQFVMLRLKTSKTDVNHTGVLIVIGATHQQNCPMTVLRKLFFKDSKPADASLFSQTKGIFSRKYLIDIMKSRLAECKIDARNYSSQSFGRGIAQ